MVLLVQFVLTDFMPAGYVNYRFMAIEVPNYSNYSSLFLLSISSFASRILLLDNSRTLENYYYVLLKSKPLYHI